MGGILTLTLCPPTLDPTPPLAPPGPAALLPLPCPLSLTPTVWKHGGLRTQPQAGGSCIQLSRYGASRERQRQRRNTAPQPETSKGGKPAAMALPPESQLPLPLTPPQPHPTSTSVICTGLFHHHFISSPAPERWIGWRGDWRVWVGLVNLLALHEASRALGGGD